MERNIVHLSLCFTLLLTFILFLKSTFFGQVLGYLGDISPNTRQELWPDKKVYPHSSNLFLQNYMWQKNPFGASKKTLITLTGVAKVFKV